MTGNIQEREAARRVREAQSAKPTERGSASTQGTPTPQRQARGHARPASHFPARPPPSALRSFQAEAHLFNVNLLQMTVSPRKSENLERAEASLLAHADAEVLVLPELFNTSYEVRDWPSVAEPLVSGETSRFLSETARKLGVYLVGGSLPELAGGRIFNTATLWSPQGTLLARHRKVHLFDIDIPGGIRFRESDFFSPGRSVTVARTPLGVVGLAVCFDVRFPELFRAMALRGAEAIFMPAAFNTTTGPAHWDLHVRGRAVENGLYLGACSPAPHPEVAYPAWGHSQWVDPWGVQTGGVGREEGVVRGTFSRERLTQVRAGLPLLAARKSGVYGLL